MRIRGKFASTLDARKRCEHPGERDGQFPASGKRGKPGESAVAGSGGAARRRAKQQRLRGVGESRLGD